MVLPEIDLTVPTGRATAGVCADGCRPAWACAAWEWAALSPLRLRQIVVIKKACLRTSLFQNAISMPHTLVFAHSNPKDDSLGQLASQPNERFRSGIRRILG